MPGKIMLIIVIRANEVQMAVFRDSDLISSVVAFPVDGGTYIEILSQISGAYARIQYAGFNPSACGVSITAEVNQGIVVAAPEQLKLWTGHDLSDDLTQTFQLSTHVWGEHAVTPQGAVSELQTLYSVAHMTADLFWPSA